MKQAAPSTGKAGSFTGHGQVLTGRAKGNNIDRPEAVCANMRHVVVQFRTRETKTQDRLRLLVNLYGPRGLEPSALKTEIKAADASEQ